MAELRAPDLTLGTKESVGKYFGLVSVIPSLVLAVYLYLLIASGALSGTPSVARIGDDLKHNLAQASVVASAAIVLALVLHPLQFAMVQTLEGYTWGRTALGRELQARRAVAHLARLGAARRLVEDLENAREDRGGDPQTILLHRDTTQRVKLMREEFALAAARLTIQQYPTRARDVLPTRLGNMLRRHELIAGQAYGLPFLEMSTHVGLVADPAHVAYMQDQRGAVDLAARMTVTSLIAAIATTALMWPHGLWLLTALIPYSAAYLTYRGAVSLASHYGEAMIAVADLNRFKLYSALHLPTPADTAAEQALNAEMPKLRAGATTLNWTYATLPAGGGDPATLAPSQAQPGEGPD